MQIHPHLALLRTLGSIALLGLSLGFLELKLKEADHRKLGKLVGDYYTAYDEEKGIQDSLSKFVEGVKDTEKRMKNQKLLAAVTDWEQVFWYVQLDRLKESLRSKGKIDEFKTKHGSGMDVAFAYWLPRSYLPKKGPFPLVITVPDEGEKPAAHLDSSWNDATLREGALLVAVQMAPNVTAWGAFGSKEAPGGVYSVMNALGVVQRELAIDFNRIFLAGSGKGFEAAAATAAAFPHLFAGLIGTGDFAASDMRNFRNLPTVFLKGGEGAKKMQGQVGELGFGNSTDLPQGSAADAWAWIVKTKREPYPSQLSFYPTSDQARRAQWIVLDGLQVAEEPRVEARIDRASNTITVDTQKVSDVGIYVNDLLVDLDKPVKFMVNGTLHEQTVERNAVEMIKIQYSSGDWGRVFTGYVKVP